jgi:hypothetical protein
MGNVFVVAAVTACTRFGLVMRAACKRGMLCISITSHRVVVSVSWSALSITASPQPADDAKLCHWGVLMGTPQWTLRTRGFD